MSDTPTITIFYAITDSYRARALREGTDLPSAPSAIATPTDPEWRRLVDVLDRLGRIADRTIRLTTVQLPVVVDVTPNTWRALPDGYGNGAPRVVETGEWRAPRYDGPVMLDELTEAVEEMASAILTARKESRDGLERATAEYQSWREAEITRLRGEAETKIAALELTDDERTELASQLADWIRRPEIRANEDAVRNTLRAVRYRNEAARWTAAHGSDRLRRIAAEGMLGSSYATYRDERLALELPGWDWERSHDGEGVEPRNPPAQAFETLDAARAMVPGAKLVAWSVADRIVDYAAQARCPFDPERWIVFFGDGTDCDDDGEEG